MSGRWVVVGALVLARTYNGKKLDKIFKFLQSPAGGGERAESGVAAGAVEAVAE